MESQSLPKQSEAIEAKQPPVFDTRVINGIPGKAAPHRPGGFDPSVIHGIDNAQSIPTTTEVQGEVAKQTEAISVVSPLDPDKAYGKTTTSTPDAKITEKNAEPYSFGKLITNVANYLKNRHGNI